MLTLPTDILCGYYTTPEPESQNVSPNRKVSQFEIEFYLEDAGNTTVDGRIYQIRKDFIQIAKPGQIRYSELPFRTAYLKFTADGEIAEKLEAAPEYFPNIHPEKTYSKINEIILLNESGNNLLLYSRILSLLNLILSDSSIPQTSYGKNYELAKTAKKFIENNANISIKLQDIAGSVHLSETYFHNVFTESVGVTPHEYLINCRIEKAKKLLWDTNIPISEVAERSGFGCQQYLGKVFKQQTGMTPAAYRKRLQQNYVL